MQAFELAQRIAQQESGAKLYLEFLRVPDLSMGLYVLPAGGIFVKGIIRLEAVMKIIYFQKVSGNVSA